MFWVVQWACALCPGTAWGATPPLPLADGTPEWDVSTHLQRWEDTRPGGPVALPWDSAGAQFLPVGSAWVNFGANVPPQWLRLPVRYAGPAGQPVYIVLQSFSTNRIDVWVTDTTGTTVHRDSLGIDIPFSTRTIPNEQPVFAFTPQPGQAYTVWVRVYNSVGSLHTGVKLFTMGGFEAFTLRGRGLFAVFLGVLLGVSLFSLLQFSTSRKRIYALYALYILSVVLWQLSANGYAYWLLWPESTRFAFYSKGLMLTLSLAMLNIFIRHFLLGAARKDLLLVPLLPYLLGLYGGVLVWAAVAVWGGANPVWPTAVGQVLWLINLLLLLHDIIRCAWARYRPAYYLVVAYTALLVFGLVYFLRIARLVPDHPLFYVAFYVLFAIEIIVMFTALLAQYRYQQKQNRLRDIRLHVYQQLLQKNALATENAVSVLALALPPDKTPEKEDVKPTSPPAASAAPAPETEEDLHTAYHTVLGALYTNARFTDPHLTVKDVAKDAGLPIAVVSRCINRVAEKNFNELVNELRVEEAKRLLADAQNDPYTTEAIGTMAGFSSRSNFFSVFKRLTGQTPNAFRVASGTGGN